MIQHQNGEIVWFQFELLRRHEDLITHGIFGRHGGVSAAPFDSLNAGPATSDDPVARLENYHRIQETLPGYPLLVGTRPQQGTSVREVTNEDLGTRTAPVVILPEGCDAFITQVRGIGLFWAVADCSVIMLVDRTHRAIGLTHAGWRGTRGAILRNTLVAMQTRYSTKPSDILAAIGPSIGHCCYEVDEPVRQEFEREPFAHRTVHFVTVPVPEEGGGERQSLRLDLVASNRAQLLELGIPERQVEVSNICSGSRTDLFFSHRMEGGHTGRFAVVLGLV
jgi:YfiH family protein